MAIADLKKKYEKVTPDDLNKWNLVSAALLLAEAIVILVISATRILSVTTNFLAVDPLATQSPAHPVLVAANHHAFDLNIAYLVAAFLIITAIAQAAVGSFYRNHYESDLKKGFNCVRWGTFALSGGLMLVTIALISGVFDLSTLIAIFALTAVAATAGSIMELHNLTTKQTNWISYWLGLGAGVVSWAIIGIYLVGASLYGNGKVPTYVYWVYWSLLLLFGCFALNMYLQYKKKNKLTNYLRTERLYIILSFIAQTALAWEVFAGTLRR